MHPYSHTSCLGVILYFIVLIEVIKRTLMHLCEVIFTLIAVTMVVNEERAMNYFVSLRPEFSVFVGDLASEVDDFQLHQVFKKYLSCKGAKVVTDQYGYSRYVSSEMGEHQPDGSEMSAVFSQMVTLV